MLVMSLRCHSAWVQSKTVNNSTFCCGNRFMILVSPRVNIRCYLKFTQWKNDGISQSALETNDRFYLSVTSPAEEESGTKLQRRFGLIVLKRFFTLIQHAKSRFLDEQRKSGILSHKMEVHGVRLHFEMTGDGDHNVLLLPGALGSSRTDFLPQLNHFNKRDFTLIAFDPRGYGQSIPPTRDWPLEFLHRDTEDAMELIKKLGLEKVSILGWSDGGISAMIAAAKYPNIVQNIVIWGSNAYITQKDLDKYNKVRDISTWSEKMRAGFMALYGEKYFREQWNNWVDAFEAYFKKRDGDICKKELAEIKARTLIVHGLKDPLVPLEHPDYIHHTIKGSKLYIMPEGKHNLHLRYYREFNFLAEHFLLGAHH